MKTLKELVYLKIRENMRIPSVDAKNIAENILQDDSQDDNVLHVWELDATWLYKGNGYWVEVDICGL